MFSDGRSWPEYELFAHLELQRVTIIAKQTNGQSGNELNCFSYPLVSKPPLYVSSLAGLYVICI